MRASECVSAIMAITLAGMTGGCAGNPSTSEMNDGNVMNIVTRVMEFEAPDSVASGWITFRFHNESPMTHFAVVERLPEGIGVKEHQEQVAPIFQEGLDLLVAGQTDEAMTKFGEIPAWFGDLVFTGGPGLTSGGNTSEAVVRLDPGNYLLECYVKTSGVFHSYNPDPNAYGMVRPFVVTATPSPAPEPQADLKLSLSKDRGIVIEGTPTVGKQTVAIEFIDQNVYENFVGHDVHLVRLTDDTDMTALVAWMDWRREDGLQTPAPAEFIGGFNEMPAGSFGYMTVTLDPGRYAWIAELPDADVKGFLKTFSVPAEDGAGS